MERGRTMNLLIVDDERAVLETLCNILVDIEFEKISVMSTAVSREAKDILKTQVIDILLTDIKMPGLNGFELAEIAKQVNPDCRIVFLTGCRLYTSTEILCTGDHDRGGKRLRFTDNLRNHYGSIRKSGRL